MKYLYHEVLLLREHGFTLKEIARMVYGSDDRRAVWRVDRLLRYARARRVSTAETHVGEHEMKVSEEEPVELQLERQPFAFREPRRDPISPAERKLFRRGVERQLVEYEELIAKIVKESGIPDPDYSIMDLARSIHYKAFYELYERAKLGNVWNTKRRTSYSVRSLAYCYSVIAAALLLWGKGGLKDRVLAKISEWLGEKLKEFQAAVREIAPHVFSIIV